MTTLDILIDQIKTQPKNTKFNDVINIINEYYDYTPAQFTNGPKNDCVINKAGENEGSCKIFSFAKIHQLDEMQTLNCFGSYYRDDVLKHPDNTDHANIRTFIRYGWKQISFEGTALVQTEK